MLPSTCCGMRGSVGQTSVTLAPGCQGLLLGCAVSPRPAGWLSCPPPANQLCSCKPRMLGQQLLPAGPCLACSYDHNGKLAEQAGAARTVGTTVAVRDLFKRLPVRCAHAVATLPSKNMTALCSCLLAACSCIWMLGCREQHKQGSAGLRAGGSAAAIFKELCAHTTTHALFSLLRLLRRHKEFLRHIKREYARLVSVLQAYALIRCAALFHSICLLVWHIPPADPNVCGCIKKAL